MLSDQLIAIDQVAKLAGTDKIHLAYLTKLRLIPQTIRRKIGNKITGCYPEYVISLIPKIEEMKNRGLTYGQIKQQIIDNIDSGSALRSVRNDTNSPFVFLTIGVILGYVLFSLNSINNSLVTNKPQVEVPAQVVTTSQKQDQPIYLIAVPDKNLYKLGLMDFASLVK